VRIERESVEPRFFGPNYSSSSSWAYLEYLRDNLSATGPKGLEEWFWSGPFYGPFELDGEHFGTLILCIERLSGSVVVVAFQACVLERRLKAKEAEITCEASDGPAVYFTATVDPRWSARFEDVPF
jgi:hypothetical protein